MWKSPAFRALGHVGVTKEERGTKCVYKVFKIRLLVIVHVACVADKMCVLLEEHNDKVGPDNQLVLNFHFGRYWNHICDFRVSVV